ncbi:hypothetical protein SGUI_2624 [Serinicoccus hydrothermalis]|uniref:PH domain-containing protein n=2 Tax=Serinicoccus hydrothermalis TaxID=1758689 RepID=A0A1B1NF10_9MICO|nr:hypothetical protein SGUI_2624 [Serinicoccus hydrothermalis]
MVVALALFAVAAVLLVIEGVRSGLDGTSVFLAWLLPFNAVTVAVLWWSSRARWTEADRHGLRLHEPWHGSVDLPWGSIADIRSRGGVLHSTIFVITEGGREYALGCVPPRDLPELQEIWRRHTDPADL